MFRQGCDGVEKVGKAIADICCSMCVESLNIISRLTIFKNKVVISYSIQRLPSTTSTTGVCPSKSVGKGVATVESVVEGI